MSLTFVKKAPTGWERKFAFLPRRVGFRNGRPVWVWLRTYQERNIKGRALERKCGSGNKDVEGIVFFAVVPPGGDTADYFHMEAPKNEADLPPRLSCL